MSQNLSIHVDADGVALVTIEVAGRPANVFTPAFTAELREAADTLARRDDVVGVVVTSAKPGGFMAGADITELVGVHDRGLDARAAGAIVAPAGAALRALERCGKPVAAAINGAALGGGYELALACHHRVLVDDPKAVVGLPEVTLGLLPAGGGTQRLPRLIGIAKALPLLLSGRHVAPAEALSLGLVDALVPDGDAAVLAARAWVCAHPGHQAPWDLKGYAVPGGAGALAPDAAQNFSIGMARVRRDTQDRLPAPLAILSCVYEGTQLPIDRALALELKHFGQLLAGPVARNLMRTQFVNRRAAQKLARRPAGVPRQPVRRLGVLGAGMMGAGIAQVAAAAGIDVVLIDASAEAAERGKAKVAAGYERECKAGRCTNAEMAQRLQRIVASADYGALDGCDFVVEAVFENRAVKAEAMARVQAALPARDAAFVFATNTSTLPVSGLAAHWPEPGRFIGVHFFSPVDRMPLVEVIVGERTEPATLARALDLVQQLRKTPIVVHDSPGFYTSRIFCAYIDEGMAMLGEGVAPALIENAAREAGFATPPLAVTDEVSLTLQQLVIDQAQADGLPERFRRGAAQPVVQRMVALQRPGRQGGGGFYDYPAGAGKRLWPGLAEHFPPRTEQPPLHDVQQRLLVAQALASAQCFEEGVLDDPADADLGAVLGLGYPAWTGGTASYIDTLGIAAFVSECDRLADRYGERFRPSAWLRARAAEGRPFHARAAEAQPVHPHAA